MPFTNRRAYGLAQRQRRDWRASFQIIAPFLAKRARFPSGEAAVRLDALVSWLFAQ